MTGKCDHHFFNSLARNKRMLCPIKKFIYMTFSLDVFHKINADFNSFSPFFSNTNTIHHVYLLFCESWDTRREEDLKEDIATRKFAIYLLTKDVHIYQIYRKEIMSIHGTFLCNSLFLNQNTRKAFFQVQGQPYFTCLYLPWYNSTLNTPFVLRKFK